MSILNLVEHYDLVEEYDSFGRKYTTSNGDVYPSITTVLGKQPKPGLDAWRERIGDDEADRIMKTSGRIGTEFHDACEQYILGEPVPILSPGASRLYSCARKELMKIDNVRGIEIPMWSDHLKVGGRSDCIGDYNSVSSIIDYKNSRSSKQRDWCTDYFLQGAAYGRMFYELYGITVKQIVIIIAEWSNPRPTVYIEKVVDWLGPLDDVMREYNPMWNN